jgi:hypothetical protein
MLYDPLSRFTNSSRGSSGGLFKAGLHVGKVSRVAANGKVFVTIPNVNPGQVMGPCSVFTESEIDVGDKVLVAFLDAKMDEVVVIGKQTA